MPKQIKDLDPFFSHCTDAFFTGYDPPRTLVPAAAMAAPVTTVNPTILSAHATPGRIQISWPSNTAKADPLDPGMRDNGPLPLHISAGEQTSPKDPGSPPRTNSLSDQVTEDKMSAYDPSDVLPERMSQIEDALGLQVPSLPYSADAPATHDPSSPGAGREIDPDTNPAE